MSTANKKGIGAVYNSSTSMIIVGVETTAEVTRHLGESAVGGASILNNNVATAEYEQKINMATELHILREQAKARIKAEGVSLKGFKFPERRVVT